MFVADALAWSLYRSGDVAGTLPLVDRALRLGTPDTLLHYHAAVILEAAGQPDRAPTQISTVLAGNPAFSFRYGDDLPWLSMTGSRRICSTCIRCIASCKEVFGWIVITGWLILSLTNMAHSFN